MSVEQNAADIAALQASLGVVEDNMDIHWLLYCGTLVFLMQAGFAMLCAGSVRAKNAQNIMLKNLLDACVGALAFWSTGYAFAYGEYHDGNWFIGDSLFFLSQGFEGKDGFHNWFFQFAFAATAATIVSGAVAERCKMEAYMGYSWFLTAFVYPVVVHWIWSSNGFLSAFLHDPMLDVGVIDFAGCGVVHMVGGLSACIGAYVLGPRIGRFNKDDPRLLKGEWATTDDIRGHSISLVVLGTFLLWVGWYGFNPGSTLAIGGGAASVASKVAVNTTIGGAAGGVTNLMIHYLLSRDAATKHGIYDVAEMCNGILAGLVAITAACAVVEPWAAFVIGIVGAFVYTAGSRALVRMEIDDAVNATPVHFCAGAWGLIAPAIFARPENMRAAYDNDKESGLLYGGGWEMMGCQLLAFVCIAGWVTLTMFPFFTLMKHLGLFRADEADELRGLDDSKHGGAAYQIEMSASRANNSRHALTSVQDEEAPSMDRA